MSSWTWEEPEEVGGVGCVVVGFEMRGFESEARGIRKGEGREWIREGREGIREGSEGSRERWERKQSERMVREGSEGIWEDSEGIR
jgi:hypothetical protein